MEDVLTTVVVLQRVRSGTMLNSSAWIVSQWQSKVKTVCMSVNSTEVRVFPVPFSFGQLVWSCEMFVRRNVLPWSLVTKRGYGYWWMVYLHSAFISSRLLVIRTRAQVGLLRSKMTIDGSEANQTSPPGRPALPDSWMMWSASLANPIVCTSVASTL